jgi:hypothetical protein
MRRDNLPALVNSIVYSNYSHPRLQAEAEIDTLSIYQVVLELLYKGLEVKIFAVAVLWIRIDFFRAGSDFTTHSGSDPKARPSNRTATNFRSFIRRYIQ